MKVRVTKPKKDRRTNVKKNHALKWLWVIGLSLGIAARGFAVLGVGDIVFDPSNYAEALQQLYQLQQQYLQLLETYQMIRNQYVQLLWMGRQVPVDMGSRYRALA